ncbi:hypothetical protein JS528_04770 [Bifidobacterium sp. MA2]|uniref:Uncharacterized protein n=2 Tax=Bifidobacterium santillanense TaxID=2809028 RepID=A0ABS5UP38_9BIFI|nr:hypothetical protein [Bifidobacterium santillanense]
MLIGTVAAAVAIFLALGFAVSWGLAAIFAIIMVPGGISMAIIARHPEKTGGRQMLGVSDPNTLLEPFTGRRTPPHSDHRNQGK